MNDKQKSMLRHCLDLRLRTLVTYFNQENEDDPYIKAVETIQQSVDTPLEDADFEKSQIYTLMKLGTNSAFDEILLQLRGLFTANFEILEMLGVINSSRDSELITTESFCSEEFRNEAVDTINYLLSQSSEFHDNQVTLPRGDIYTSSLR